MPENKSYKLKNEFGDIIDVESHHTPIIDKHLENNNHSAIDDFYDLNHKPSNTVKVNGKDYDVRSKEYKDLYDSGHLASYDAKTNTYYVAPLKEITVTAERPQWAKDKLALEKQYSKDWYIDNLLPKWARATGTSADNMGGSQKGYDAYINNKVAESILKRNPNFDKDYSNDRLKTLSNYSQKELEIIKNSNLSHKIEPSIWSKFEQGLLSVGNVGSPVTFKNENLTQEEAKKEDNPLNILQPLTVPSKMVQSSYKDGYSFTDALKGKNNNAGIVEDIVTDPLNLVGVGLAGKLSKADKIIDATKAGSKVLNKIDDAVNNINRIKFDDFKNDNEFFRVIVGDEAFDDIVQTQKIRTKQPSSVKNTPPNTINLDRRGSTAFPSFSKGSPSLSYANDNPNHYIIRTADESIKPSTSGRHGKGTTMFPTDKSGKHLTELDASKVQVYKHVGNGEYELVNTAKPIISSVDDVVKNLPKLEQIPLDFKIEDVLKNISSTERKNMEIMKKGDAYFKELDNPESLKRLKEFGDEYSIDLLDAYKKAEKRWDYGNNIGKHDRFQVAGKEVFKDDIESALGLSTVTDDYFKMKLLKPKSKTLIPENKSEIDKYSINYINKKASLKDYDTIVWHELSHDINKNIIGQSTKLQKDLSDIFVKNIDEIDKTKVEAAYKSQKFDTYEKGLVKSKKENMSVEDIAKDELAYVTKPTETWAFLSTNLRQDLKNTGVIKNYNELLTSEKLEQAIKNGNTVFSRFEPYIKDKDAFIKLFNKMTLSIAPAVLYLQSQNQQNNKEQ